MLIVYTTVFGNTDPLHEPEATGNARFVCFTDRPLVSRGWEIVRVPSPVAPTRTARTMKILSHKTFPHASATLWVDACFTLAVDPQQILDDNPGDIVTFLHRDRARITDEAREIIRLGKARADATTAQLAAYREDGFDTDANPQRSLSCNGAVLRRHTDDVARFNEFWAGQITLHTLRDQMSADYSAWKTGVCIDRFPGFHNDNPYFRHQHYKRPVNDY